MAREEILAALAEMNPTDDYFVCFFCSAYEPKGVEDHEPDCIWAQAARLPVVSRDRLKERIVTDELPCIKADREAAERVAALLALPMPDSADMRGLHGEFDPWEMFPSLLGSYSNEFDKLAIEVLCDVRDNTYKRDGLDVEMFREMLCTAKLCNYGTSPRTCFPTRHFRELLPALIEKWRTYSALAWGGS